MKLANESRQVRNDLWTMCSRSMLFWVRSFVWTYAPLIYEDKPCIPFIPYPRQEEMLKDVNNAIGKHDLVAKKSRDQGASWGFMLPMIHRWLFRQMQSFLLVSRTAEYVEKRGNPKALFSKVDFLLERLPGWMLPDGLADNSTYMHRGNPETGSVLDGEACTGDVGAGDRRNAVLLDEYSKFDLAAAYKALASTLRTTRCRLINATPEANYGAYYDVAHMEGVKVLTLHWSDHPVQREGLYRSVEGNLQLLDKEYWDLRPEKKKTYDFILDGKIRSPFYDTECAKCPVDSIIASQLDIDFLGAGNPVFNAKEVEDIRKKHVTEPWSVGDPIVNEQGEWLEYRTGSRGTLKMWTHVDNKGRIVERRHREYVIGVDVSSGTGASNSVASVWDCTTHAKVAEYANPNISEAHLAEFCCALGNWFAQDVEEKPTIIFERNGPGRAFANRLIEIGYENIYYKRNEEDPTKKISQLPGCQMDKQLKRASLLEYGRALSTGEAVDPSKEAIKEMSQFIYTRDGGIEHQGAVSAVDPSGASANHGDRVTAGALAWLVLRRFDQEDLIDEETDDIPIGSKAWRIQEHEMALADSWDDGGDEW